MKSLFFFTPVISIGNSKTFKATQDLSEYGVVEMIGGNPYYLLNAILTRGFKAALTELAQERCLIGCSAGSVVMTPTLKLIDQYSPEMNLVGLENLTAQDSL